MGIPSVFKVGVSGMMASKAAVSTTGHNISNANTEGYSRQRVITKAEAVQNVPGKGPIYGHGTAISRVDRINDEYVEKQIRNGGRDLAFLEEKDLTLRQTEDIFNEMNGDGLNRLVSRFFNEFRKLSNEPDSEAIRQSVREATGAMVNDFRRLRKGVEDVRRLIDARIEGYATEVNTLADEVKDLNAQIRKMELAGVSANDLQDARDVTLKKLSTYMDLAMHKDNSGNFIVEIRNVGPLVVGPQAEKLSVNRSPDDGQGKPEGSMDIRTTASANGLVTHAIKGGKIGALLEVRDKTLSMVLDRLDELAFSVSQSVNDIHAQGFNRFGQQGVAFFKPMAIKDRAAEFITLSDEISANINNIATGAVADAPGDNRIAIAISNLQSMKVVNGGQSTFDDFYNSIVSDVGVITARNRASINQQKDIVAQLGKMREQISGVSIDEETTNLMQFQHMYDASAKVIQVADELLKTVLDLKR